MKPCAIPDRTLLQNNTGIEELYKIYRVAKLGITSMFFRFLSKLL